jgi:hypothetical protein
MTNVHKNLTLILILVMTASSFTIIGNVAAEIPKPEVPEFTVRIVSNPYDVATTYSTDQYTGETITHAGYHVENRSIEVTVKNQAYSYSNGTTFQVYYNVRTKPYFGDSWTEMYPTRNWPVDPIQYAYYIEGAPRQLSSEYTLIAISLNNYPENGQVDFQVEAMVGHKSLTFVADHPLAPNLGGEYYEATVYDTSSGWSSTETLTIGDDSTAPAASSSPSVATVNPSSSVSQNPTSTPDLPVSGGFVLFGLDLLDVATVVLLGVVVVLLVFVVFYLHKRR